MTSRGPLRGGLPGRARASLTGAAPHPDPDELPVIGPLSGAFVDDIPRPAERRPARTSPRAPVQQINLARCRVTGVRELGNAEKFLSEERKIYPNNSKTATLTKEISVSNSIARTVTIESSKLKGNSGEAGVTFIGFATVRGQAQQQLNERYSVATQNSVTISEKTTIEIPPGSTVEHVIQWKLVSLNGIAVLGETPRFSPSFDLAMVPYQVPLRLTYTETLNDVPRRL